MKGHAIFRQTHLVEIEKLPDPRVLLVETDWGALDTAFAARDEDHPFGAVLSTRAALGALTSGGRDAVTRALDHLSDVVLHQECLYGETGAAAVYVAALLADHDSQEALAPAWEAGRRPLRAKLLNWLAAVAHTVSDVMEEQWKEWDGSLASSPVFQEVRALRPALFRAVSACIADPDPAVREAALAASIPLLDAPELFHDRAALIPVLRRELAASPEQGHRLVAIFGLRAWGEDTTALAAHAELIEHERREEEWRQRQSARLRGESREPAFDEPPF
ncbi:hypothetical protein GCM10027176_28840 [Actinoallomurus bryophytorum]